MSAPTPRDPAVPQTHISVDICPRHGHAMLAVMTMVGEKGYGVGQRVLGPKSCCPERREVARWPVTPDDLRRIALDLKHAAPASETPNADR